MSITCLQIFKDFPQIFQEMHGRGEVTVKDIAPIEDITPGSLIFVANPRHLEASLNSEAHALAVSPEMFKAAIDAKTDKTLLVTKQMKLALALTTAKFFPLDDGLGKRIQNIHPTAVIGAACKIDGTVCIDAHTVIGDNVTILANTTIGANSVIEKNVEIGNHTHIHPLVFISAGCKIGNHCEIKSNTTIGSEGFGFATDSKGHHFRVPQRGIVVLENNVFIGSNCTIDRATFKETRIKEGSKLDNIMHVAHNCTLGRHGLYTAGLIMAGSTTTGDHNVYGGHCSITGHIKITDHVHLGGRTAVTGNIDKPGAYGGHPTQPLKEYLKSYASMVHLPQLRKDVKKILKHLGLDSKNKEKDIEV